MSTDALLAPIVRDHERARLLHSRADELEMMVMRSARPIQHSEWWCAAVRRLREEADQITSRWDLKERAPDDDEH